MSEARWMRPPTGNEGSMGLRNRETERYPGALVWWKEEEAANVPAQEERNSLLVKDWAN
jgi:hypothetical protein